MTGHRAVAVGLLAWALGPLCAARAEAPAQETAKARSSMAKHVSGTFDVKLVPQGADDKAEGATLGRLSIDKHYHGSLEATGQGQMLTAVTDVKGSAGYVAIERVTGSLDGRTGSFVLQHSGTMSAAGGPQLSITVVPDSGAGQLRGLVGKLSVRIVDGQHFYDFEYTLPDMP
jgi:hypothetical protein